MITDPTDIDHLNSPGPVPLDDLPTATDACIDFRPDIAVVDTADGGEHALPMLFVYNPLRTAESVDSPGDSLTEVVAR